MLRNCSIEEISEGKYFSSDDLAKVNCHGCEGCDKCCHNMGNTVVLDPYDIYQLETGLNVNFETLMADAIELNVVDGLILPNLKMGDGSCNFLKDGRCSIHSIRPGICRMFPLGRWYREDSFVYFVQKDECPAKNRSKIKIKDWLGIDNIKEYERFIKSWHDILHKLRLEINDEDERKKKCMMLLSVFYIKQYDGNSFWEQYYKRVNESFA